MWIVYEILLLFAFLCYLPKAVWRRRLPHPGWSMRLGRYPQALVERLQGRTSLWVHAVSVGEVQAAQPLLERLLQQRQQESLVVSTVTPGGFQVASKLLIDRGIVIYAPLDLRRCVRRALDILHPGLLLLVESELWPILIHGAQSRGVPVAVVNGRISERAFRRYGLVKPWLKGILDQVDAFLMQSQTDADRILALGAPPQRVHVVGSLKWDASLTARPSPQVLQETAKRLGLNARHLLLVGGSTHRGEEPALLQAFQELRQTFAGLRLIVAPRHLERLNEVEGLMRHAGCASVRLSSVSSARSWNVGLVDIFGELPRYYGVATAVFIGGSLIPHGGQNPLEAASLGKPIVFGSFMQNFEAIAHQLLAHHGARQVADGRELPSVLRELLTDPEAARAMGQRAQELTERFQGATQRTLDALQPLLTPSTKHQIPSSK